MDIPWKSIIILIIVILIIYFIWKIMSSSSKSVSVGAQAANTQTTLSEIIKSKDLNFSISTWIYVSTWTDKSANKPIITTTKDGGVAPSYNMVVALDPTKNNILITVTGTTGTTTIITQPNIPLQTWVSIIVNVNNGTVFDLYINGKLVITQILTTEFKLPEKVYIGSTAGFDGFISNTTYTPTTVNPENAWNTYAAGYDGSGGTISSLTNMFNKYKIRFAFVKDNTEVSRFEI